MKILVVTAAFDLTGVPLAQQRLARALARAGHDITLMYGRVEEKADLISRDGLRVVVTNSGRAAAMLVPLMRYLRAQRPDIVFAAEDHMTVVTLAAAVLSGSSARISGSSRVPPNQTYSSRPLSKRWFLKQAMRMLMWRADALTCVSYDMVDHYRAIFRNAPHEGAYNIIGDPDSLARANQPVDDPWLTDNSTSRTIVAAGTLHHRKGFQDLIPALAEVRSRGHDVRLLILGEGPQRKELEQIASRLGIADHVRMPGKDANPLPYFSKSGLFALTSHEEGMPNVLVEAMMCGATPIATDCPTGPRELLRGGKYGYLAEVGSPSSIADAIERALATPIAQELLTEALEPFDEHRVIARHMALLGLNEQP